MATPHTSTPGRKGLLGTLFPRTSPIGLTGEGAGKPANVQALEMEISLLKSRVEKYQGEFAQFEGEEPYYLGTEHITGLVPPIAGATMRSTVGSPTMAGYLLSSDAWQIMLSRFLKPNSVLLDVGCGSGKMARNLTYHPYVRRYIGFDVLKDSIDFCNDILVPRIGDKFEFHHLDVYSRYNPTGTMKATDAVFPVKDGSVDLAWGCSLWTHLYEADARHYLHEVRRSLSKSGLFIATIHTQPESGTRYSGDEVKTDVDAEYFVEMCDDAGLELAVRLGEVLGQYAMIFKVKPGSVPKSNPDAGIEKPGSKASKSSKGGSTSVPEPPNNGILTDEMLRLNKQWAAQEQVAETINPKDFIFWFVATHPNMSLEEATKYYFEDGARSAARLDGHLARLLGERKQPIKLLEFASGYGCVSRHLKKNPRFDLTSCDIHPEAIEFLTNTIGVKALQSAHTPAAFTAPDRYDAVFALSFFSHMPKSTFGPWIKALYSVLAPGGHLLFTTHGVQSCTGLEITLDDADEEGFWFQARSEQHDLDAAEYGLTLSLPQFVVPTINKAVDAPIVDYRQAEWWFHQDLWVVKKPH